MAGNQRLGGMIQVQVAGVMQSCKGNFEYNLGIPKRTPVMGATGVLGYTEEAQPAFLKGSIVDRADLDMAAFLATTNATVTLAAGNGKTIMFRDAWQTADGTVKTEDGEVEIEFNSRFQAKEV